jgi:hypothetical protein
MKADLDCHNHDFDRLNKERVIAGPSNMLQRNVETVAAQSEELRMKQPKKVIDTSFLEGMEVHTYSSQRYNSAELQKQALRAKMQGRDDELYTYSPEFNSGCFPMLEKDIDPINLLRQADEKYVDTREPWRWPKPRDKMDYVRPDRDVSYARHEELQAAWTENELNPGLEPRPVVQGAFDMKTLGTGGSHVIQTRRPGHQESTEPPPPPPKEDFARPPMRFTSGYASMGQPAVVDKYKKTILDGPPLCRGFRFEARSVPRKLAQKYGNGKLPGRNVECPPVSFNCNEMFQEPYKGNSEYPNQYALSLARPVQLKAPPGTDTRSASKTNMMRGNQQTPTDGTWIPKGSKETSGTHNPLSSTGGASFPPLPLSARGPGTKESTRRTPRKGDGGTIRMPMSARG